MSGIVARRYAKALIQIGQEDGLYEKYGEELKSINDLMEASAEFKAVMLNPIYDKELKKDILKTVSQKLGLSPVVTNFLLLLVDKRRIGHFQAIVRSYEELADEVAGRIRAQVTSAVPLDEQTLNALRGKLEAMTGRKVIMSVVEDKGLIGGIVTKIGDTIYDGSVRTQLASLKEILMKG